MPPDSSDAGRELQVAARAGDGARGPRMLGGAGIGAALGAIGGAIGGSAGKGAAIGAAGGGLLGGLHSTSQKSSYKKEHKQWEKEQTAQYQQGRNNYNRAYSGCMSGRGYTVS